SNGLASAPISVRTKAGTWKNFSPGAVLGGNFLLSDIISTRSGHKWIIRPRGFGILVFDDGGTIEDTSDDQYKVLTNFAGNGGLPSGDVYCFAEDLDGQLWVGTNRGPAVFYSPEAVFGDSDFDAQQILIEQD